MKRRVHCSCPETGYADVTVFPDDSHKELAAVLSYMAGRMLTCEEIRRAMELPRSTYYAQLEKGMLLRADNLRVAAANLGLNGAELLMRYRLIDPADVASLAEELLEPSRSPSPHAGTLITDSDKPTGRKRSSVIRLRPVDECAAAVVAEADSTK